MIRSKVCLVFIAVALCVCTCLPCFAFAKDELCVGKAALLMETSSGRVLYEKNSHEKLPMASTTKIATALTVLKHARLDNVVTVDSRAVGIEGSSVYLREGEKLTVEELLYALMLRSGNDAAVALALHVGGSVEKFVDMMNDVATTIGAMDTRFDNPHGLHSENHYTTAYDLALITRAAMQDERFCKIVSSKSAVITNDGMAYKRQLKNKNKLLFSFDGANGVKTGYTKKAGRCFVGSAYKNGMQLIAVVLNCAPMFENAELMLDFGFSQYTITNIISKNRLCGAVVVDGKTTQFVCKEGFDYPLTKQETKLIEKRIELPKDESDCGKITVLLSGKPIFESNLTKY